MPLEYRLTGVSRNLCTSAKSTISSSRRSIAARDIPRIVPFRYTFSSPVSSGWNPVPTSSRDPTLPAISIHPEVGGVMRLRIFNSVLLPAPFLPMTPTTSPWPTSKLRSSSAVNRSRCTRPRIGWRARRSMTLSSVSLRPVSPSL